MAGQLRGHSHSSTDYIMLWQIHVKSKPENHRPKDKGSGNYQSFSLTALPEIFSHDNRLPEIFLFDSRQN